MTSGHCLCTSVGFSLKVQPRFFYRCHCSLCRLQTGVGHNLATLVRIATGRMPPDQLIIGAESEELAAFGLDLERFGPAAILVALRAAMRALGGGPRAVALAGFGITPSAMATAPMRRATSAASMSSDSLHATSRTRG